MRAVIAEDPLRPVRTDQRGWYEVTVPVPQGVLECFAEGYLPQVGFVNGRSDGTQEFSCEGEGPWRRDFTLAVAASLRGRVMDESLGPVAGATVYVIEPAHVLLDRAHGGNVVRSGKDGFFLFHGVPAGTWDVGVRAEGFVPAMEKDVAVPERGSVQRDVVLKPGRRMLVTVIGGSGHTDVLVADSRLRGRLLPPGGLHALATGLVGREFIGLPAYWLAEIGHETDASGITRSHAEFPGLGPGAVDVAAHHSGWITEPGLGSVLDSTAEKLELRLLQAGQVWIDAFDAATQQPIRPSVARETQGVAGRFPLDLDAYVEVPRDERTHVLHFELEGYEPAQVAVPRELPAKVRVDMQPVAEGETGEFLLEFEPAFKEGWVAAVGRDAEGRPVWQRQVQEPDREGRWRIPKVPVGSWSVSVLATGMIPASLPRVDVRRGYRETYRVRLERGGGLDFKVTDAEGALLEKVHLFLKDPAERQVDVHVMTQVSGQRGFVSVNYVPSAAAARADSGLAPGAYTLTAWKEGYEPATESFAIRGTEVAQVTIVLKRQ